LIISIIFHFCAAKITFINQIYFNCVELFLILLLSQKKGSSIADLFHTNAIRCIALGIVADSPQRRRPNGQQERQSDRRELLTATMLPTAFRLRTMSGKPDGERSEPERPNKEKKISFVSVN
jgi:hypothetical protein